MKTLRRQLITASVVLCALVSYSQSINEPYAYPVVPGTPEWKKFQSQSEMIAACQVPADILMRLSTSALIETCLKYPLFPQVVAYNSIQRGFDNLAINFNGFRELFARKDAAVVLFDKYKTMSPSGYSKEWTSVRQGLFIYDYLFVELLLSQDPVLANLDAQRTKLLATESIKMFDGKLGERALFGMVGLTHTTYLMSKLLYSVNDTSYKSLYTSDNKVKTFQETVIVSDLETLNKIRNLTVEYVNRK